MTTLLSVQETAAKMSVTCKHVYTLARRGAIASRRGNGPVMLEKASVEAYMAHTAAKPLPAILENPEELRKRYNELRSQADLAKEIGVRRSTLRKALRRHGIPILTRSQASRPQYRPQKVSLKRWMDVAIIFLEHGVKPPALTEMCPPNCPGREQCLDGGDCIKVQGSTTPQRRRS